MRSVAIENTRVNRLQMGDCMNRCFAIALSILTLTCGALAEPISVTEILGGNADADHRQEGQQGSGARKPASKPQRKSA
jgi:hypothetical protein